MRASRANSALLVLVLAVATAGPGTTQSSGELHGEPFLATSDRWSPLVPVADIPTLLLHSGAMLPRHLLAPEPRVGAAWTAGNPAGFAVDLQGDRSEFWLVRSVGDGDYRRPNDPVSRTAAAIGLGGERTAGSGGVIGRIALHDQRLEGSHALGVDPFTSSPHALSDSAGVDMRQSVVRLEGAGGWTVGPVHLGVGLGYRAWDGRSEADANPRFQRGSTSGVVVGALYSIAPVGVRIGPHLRVRSGAEMYSRTARTDVVRLVPVLGYGEPVPRNLAPVTSRPARTERSARAVGMTVAGDAGGIGWAAFAERATSREEQSTAFENEPPIDLWEASAIEVGGAARGSLAPRFEWVLELGWTRLEGDANRPEFAEEGILFEALESRVVGSIELRSHLAERWTLATRVRAAREARERTDLLAGLTTDLATWSPGAGAELTGRLTDGFSIGVAYGLVRAYPVGRLPNPDQLGPGYRRWVAPELSIYATPGTAREGAITARVDHRGRAIWLRLGYDTLAPTGTSRLPALPPGERARWAAAGGIVMP
jgi:hypothetical protein